MVTKHWIAILAAAFFTIACAGPSKSELDAEVKRMCAIDGGIRIYETVPTPRDKFNQWGQVNFYRATQKENALGPDYLFREAEHIYRKGDPDLGTGQAIMGRLQYQVFRKVDGKLLGETVVYGRRGGDLPGPWHPSAFACPDPNEAGVNGLLKRIFVPAD